MRRARLKPNDRDHYYHVYNRIVGLPGELPFGSAEKEKFLRILRRLANYYVVEVIAYQVMSNHYHLVVHVPGDVPSAEEACSRYHNYHHGRRTIARESAKCEELRHMLRDLSCFMHDLQQQFTTWFNKTRLTGRRRGSLWAGRFKSTMLQEGRAVRAGIIYTQMNPVRAGMVKDPADYRFSSWGYWCRRGRRPFGGSSHRALCVCFSDILGEFDIEKIREWFQRRYKLLCGDWGEARADNRHVLFTMRADSRVRYWADGMVIGSQLFVLGVLKGVRGLTAGRLIRSEECYPGEGVLWTYPMLRRVSP